MRQIKRKQANYVHISMLNLIDVIFILLIFFMLTTTFKKYWQFEIDLPAASSTSAQKSMRCEVAIDAAGAAWWLDAELKRPIDELALASLKECEQVLLSAHKGLSYERVIALISELNAAQIKEIQLNIERK